MRPEADSPVFCIDYIGRLYWVSGDTLMQDNHTQLLVHKSHQEMIFQVAQYNPMPGDMCFDKTLEQIMSRIYRPGIQGRCVPVVGAQKRLCALYL